MRLCILYGRINIHIIGTTPYILDNYIGIMGHLQNLYNVKSNHKIHNVFRQLTITRVMNTGFHTDIVAFFC